MAEQQHHIWQYETSNGLTVTASLNEHPSHRSNKKYYDTGSMALACTAGECDVVDLTKEED